MAMWRRVASLSPLIRSSSSCKLAFLNQVAYRLNISELFTTEVNESPLTKKDLFISFVL
ncbi:hypothetical protein CRG98_013841, partial [Punica granatum]